MADHWFDTKGAKTVFFCRFIPIVRSLISIPAGMSEMNVPKFLVYTTIGSLIWNTVLVVIGAALGDNWEKLVLVMDEYSNIALILIIILFIVIVFMFYKSKFKQKKINRG